MRQFLRTIEKPVYTVLYWYVVLVLMYQLLNLTFPFAFVESVLPLNLVSQALAIVGLLFLAYDMLVTRRCFEKRYARILWLLVGTLALSSVLLPDYGTMGNGLEPSIVANAKAVVWQMDLMLVIFPYCASLSKERMLKLVRTVYWAACAAYIPCLLVSFWQYGFSIGYDAVYGTSTGMRQGFQEGRLFGLMTGVFSGGMMTMVLTIASIYLALKAERKYARTAYGIFAALYFLYSVLSGTRSVFVALVFATFVAAAVYFMKGGPRGALSVIGSFAKAAASALFVVIVYLGVSDLCTYIPIHNAEEASTEEAMEARDNEQVALVNLEQDATGAAYPIVAVYFDGALMLSCADGSNAPFDGRSLAYFDGAEDAEMVRMGEVEGLDGTIVARRTDIGKESEMSNGRIAIWSDYVKVAFSDAKTALFGLSPGYYMPAIYEGYAGTDGLYIIEYIEERHPNMIANGLIYDVHNAYVGVLIQSGLVGCVLIALFVLRLIVDALRVYWRQDSRNRSLLAWTMAIAFIMGASFFDSELFFRTTAASVMFWVLCGFAVNELNHLGNKTSKADKNA